MTNHESTSEPKFSNKAPLAIEEAAYAENALYDLELTIKDEADLLRGKIGGFDAQNEAQIIQEFSELKLHSPAIETEAEFLEKYKALLQKVDGYSAVDSIVRLGAMMELRAQLQPGEPFMVVGWNHRTGLEVAINTIKSTDDPQEPIVYPSVSVKDPRKISSQSRFKIEWNISTDESGVISVSQDDVSTGEDEVPRVFVGKDQVIRELDRQTAEIRGNSSFTSSSTLVSIANFYESNGETDKAKVIRLYVSEEVAYDIKRYAEGDNHTIHGSNIPELLDFIEIHKPEAYEEIMNKARRSAASFSQDYANRLVYGLVIRERGTLTESWPPKDATPVERLHMLLKLAEEGELLIAADEERDTQKKLGNRALL